MSQPASFYKKQKVLTRVNHNESGDSTIVRFFFLVRHYCKIDFVYLTSTFSDVADMDPPILFNPLKTNKIKWLLKVSATILLLFPSEVGKISF